MSNLIKCLFCGNGQQKRDVEYNQQHMPQLQQAAVEQAYSNNQNKLKEEIIG